MAASRRQARTLARQPMWLIIGSVISCPLA
jgi:hypothetical protein